MSSPGKFRKFVSSAALCVIVGVLCFVIARNSGPLGGVSDERFGQLAAGDHVSIRRERGKLKLDVYSRKAHEGNAPPEMQAFIATLPVLKEIRTDHLILSPTDGTDDFTVAGADIGDLFVRQTIYYNWSLEEAQAPSFEDLEVEIFGDVDRAVDSQVLDSVLAADTPVTAAVLNSISWDVVERHDEEIAAFREVAVDDYLSTTTDTPEQQEVCHKFLTAYIRRAIQADDAPSRHEILQLAEDATAVSTDEIVGVYATRTQHPDTINWTAEKRFDSLLDPLESSGRSPVTAIHGRLWNLRRGTVPERTDRFIACSKQFLAYLAAHPEHIPAASNLYQVAWSAVDWPHQRRIIQSLIANPDCPKFLVHLLAYRYHHSIGWGYRGTQLYHRIPAHDREMFEREMDKAAFHALAAMSLYPKSPYPPSNLLNISRTKEVDLGTSRAWFLAGIRNRPYDDSFYNAYLTSLYPKWGGSERAMLDFASACSQCSRFDTAAPYFTLTCLYRLQREVGDREGRNLWMEPKLTTIVRQLLGTLNTGDPDTRYLSRIEAEKSRAAALAFRAGNFTLAKACFESLRGDPTELMFQRFQLGSSSLVRRRVYARTGPAAELAETLDLLISRQFEGETGKQDISAARTLIEQLRAKDENEHVQELCTHYESVLNAWQSFEADEVVPLEFGDKSALWRIPPSHAFYDNDQLVIDRTSLDGDLAWVPLKMVFPLPYEFSVEFSLNKGEARGANVVGILLKDEAPRSRDQIHRNECLIYALEGTNDLAIYNRGIQPRRVPDSVLEEKNKLVLQARRGSISITLNGKPLPTEETFDTTDYPTLSIGAYELGHVKARLWNATIRKLDSAQDEPAQDEPAQE